MKLIVIGALGGLAWAGGLRAYMAELAGAESTVTWVGTMAAVLAPAVAVGGLLGWAEELRRDGGRPNWRKLALAPLLLPVVALAMPGAVTTLVTTGMGGGAIAVTVIGMAGAHALAGRGPAWLRGSTGALAFSIIPLWSVASVSFGSDSFGANSVAVTTPRGALLALHFFALLAVLAVAGSIPLRPVVNAVQAVTPNSENKAAEDVEYAAGTTPIGTVRPVGTVGAAEPDPYQPPQPGALIPDGPR